jgi:hypothetical protein
MHTTDKENILQCVVFLRLFGITGMTLLRPVILITRILSTNKLHTGSTYGLFSCRRQRDSMDSKCNHLDTVAQAIYNQADWRHANRLDFD